MAQLASSAAPVAHYRSYAWDSKLTPHQAHHISIHFFIMSLLTGPMPLIV